MKSDFALSSILEFAGPRHVLWNERKLLYFGGCDYLRLSHHSVVRRAVSKGLRRFGLNVSASRLTTGNHPLYLQLETRLQEFFSAPACAVVPTGYSSNLIVAQALASDFSHVILDTLDHSSLQDATRFLSGKFLSFRHGSCDDLKRVVRSCGARAKILVMTDGMFAYDGSVPPLKAYRKLLPSTAWMLIDDAHGAGVVGKTGRGSLEEEGLGYDRIIQTITLSKAFGSYGGAVLGPLPVIRQIQKGSRLFAGSTPAPLPLVFASLTALELFEDHPEWLERMRKQTQSLRQRLRHAGLPAPDHPGPIISFAPKPACADRLRRALLSAQIYPSFLRYPGGPARGYFRFALSAAHRPADLEKLGRALIDVLAHRR